MRRSALAFPLVCAVLSLVACGGDDAEGASPAADSAVASDSLPREDAAADAITTDTRGPSCVFPDPSTVLQGGINAKFDTPSSGGGGSGAGPDGWHYTTELATGGFLELNGPKGNPADGEVSGLGVLGMPTDGPDPGAHFCAGAGTTVVKNAASGVYSFVLRDVARLGTCSDAVGADVIDGCFSDTLTVPDAGAGAASCVKNGMHLVGTLDGAPLDTVIVDVSGGLGTGGPSALHLGPDGYMDLRGEPAAVGTVILPTTITPGPVVRCLGPGSTQKYDSDALRFHLVLARLGTCAVPSNTASIVGCSR